MGYPKTDGFKGIIDNISLYTQLKHEYGATGIASILGKAEKDLRAALARLQKLPVNKGLARREPDDLPGIRKRRPEGPRRIWKDLDPALYREKLEGAMLSRFAGCTLGAPVECWTVEKMANLARENGEPFPPVNYWKRVPEPFETRYGADRRLYTLPVMDGVPVDDDITYTLLGLLTAEDYGHDFSIEDNGKAWVKYLPMACTAEDIALQNLKKKVPAKKTADVNNPFCQWIGADIRSDPWGYLAAGYPEYAADMAYRDAFLSHRRNGIYGEMFFSAAIAAAFTVKHPIEAIEIGLTEIPRDCALAEAVKWALKTAPKIRNYADARKTIDEHFSGMHIIHTNNNACCTVFGCAIGGTDVTRVIGETVAMGMDNDCTAATAGSLVGAVVGKKGVPRHWYQPFRNTVYSYIIGHPRFAIDDLVNRFAAIAERIAARK